MSRSRDVEGYVCPNCGKSDSFHQKIEVTIYSTRAASLVEKDGKLVFEFDDDYDRYGSDEDVWGTGPVRCDCGAEFKNGTDDLRYVYPAWQPGDIAILPDGLRGYVERVVDGLIHIVGWHERFTSFELAPLIPISRSEPLIPDGS